MQKNEINNTCNSSFDKASQNITKTMFYFRNLFKGDPIKLKMLKC